MYPETFESRLARSHLAVWVAAAWHWSEGRNVRVPKTVDDRPDDGDLFVRERKEETWRRVEVKQIRRDFTGYGDWPFEKVIVCAEASFNRAEQKPYQYLIFNHRLTHAIRIMGEHHNDWWIEEITDSRKGSTQRCYCTFPNLVNFLPVPPDLMVQP